MKKRVLSLFLALTLCLTLTPTGALAAEGQPPEQTVSATQEAQIPAPAPEEKEKEEEKTTPAQTGAGENAPPAKPEENPTEDAPAAAEKNTADGETDKEAAAATGRDEPKADGSPSDDDAAKVQNQLVMAAAAGPGEPTMMGQNNLLALADEGQTPANAQNSEGGGIYVAPGSPTEGGGGTYIPGEDTRTEIWCVSKPDSIGRSYDGTTDGGTISIDLTFTDGTNEIKLKEGTGFTAKKTFESADAGWHTVTVEIALSGDAAAKYKLKAGEEKFTIGGNINKAYPKLTVSLSKTACTAGEKLLPLLSVEGAPEDAEVTYYYLASELKSWAGSSDVEGSDAMPKINENTAISEPGTYYVYAKTGETTNYEEERSTTVELTVNEAVVEAASVTKADGADGGTYESLPAALDAAQNGDTVKLLADHTTKWSDVEGGEYATLAVVKKTLTLDLNGMTVDYLTVGDVVPDEAGGILESYDGNLTVVDNIQGGSCGKIKDLEFVKGSLAIQGGRIGDSLTCDGNSGTVTISGGTVCNATVGDGATVTVTGGTGHAGTWFNDGTLKITDGTFGNVNFLNNGGTIAISGGTFGTITNINGSSSCPLMPLLADNYAFYQGDNAQNSTEETLTNVTVRSHTHSVENGKCDCGASYVASVTSDAKSTNYTSLDDALDAAQDGDTVTLIGDAEVTKWHSLSKAFTLELNGKTVTTQSKAELYLYARVIVQDSSTGKTGGMAGTALLNVQEGGDLIIKSGTFNGRIAINVGKLTIEGGTFNQEVDLRGGDSDSVFFSGGTFAKIWYPNSSGSFLDLLADGCAFYDNDGNLVNAAEISGTFLYNVQVQQHTHSFTDGACACGYTCPHTSVNENGVCEICNKQFAASITEGNDVTYYDLFNDALVYAFKNDGCTLKLLADVTGTTVMINNPFLFDLNGHNVDALSVDARATIKDSGKEKGKIGKVTVTNNKVTDLTLGDLLEAGYAFKYGNGYWANDSYLQTTEGSFVTVEKAPIQSVNVYAKDKNNQEILTIAYGATGEVTLVSNCELSETSGKNLSCAWYKLTDDAAIPPLDGATGTSYTLPADLPAGKHTYWVTFTSDGYSKSKEITITVTPVSLKGATVTVQNPTYNSKLQEPKVTVKLGDKTLSRDNDYSVQVTKQTDAGSYKLTIKGGGNYSGEIKDVEWKIEPMQLYRFCNIKPVTKVYDGTAVAPIAKSALAFHDANARGASVTLPEDAYDITNARFTMRQSDGTYADSPEAGDGKSLSFTVTLKSDNYVFQGGKTDVMDCDYTTDRASMFTITQDTIDLSSIQFTQYVFNDLAKTYAIELKPLLDEILSQQQQHAGREYGDIVYGQPSVSMNSAYYTVGGANIENGKLSLSINKATSSKQGEEIGTVAVKVETTNYQPFTLTIHVSAQDKLVPFLAEGNTVSATGITYGQTLADSKLTVNGTMQDTATGNAVNGTFAWTDGTIKPAAGDYTAEWTFTPAEGYEEYATATGTVTVKVNKATPTFTAPTAQENLTYTGQEQALITAGMTDHGTMQYSLTENGTYSQDIPTGTDAGAYIVWYRVIGDANHNDTAPASVAVRIGQKPLTITGVTAASKLYDGTTDAGITSVTFDNVTLKRDTDYTVTASYDDAGVGSGKNVTATVTLMGQAAKNYALEQSSLTTTGSITKAAAPDFTKETALVIINGHEKTYTVTLPALPTLETPKEYGAPTYELGNIKLNAGYYTSGAKVENDELTLPIQKNDVETTGSVGTATVVIKSTNYEDITLTVNVSAVNQPVPVDTITATPITYGNKLSASTITGKMKDPTTGHAVDGTFTWLTPAVKLNAGSHSAKWIFTPDKSYGGKYTTNTGTATVTVNPKAVTVNITPNGGTYGSVTAAAAKLSGAVEGDNVPVTLTYTGNGYNSTAVPTNAGSYTVTASIADSNYVLTGETTANFVIEPKSIKGAKVVLGKALTANGAEQTQTVEKVLLDGKELPADSYTVAGNTATTPSSHTLTITAKGNYTGTVEQTYVIIPAKAESAPGEEIAIGSGKVKVDVQSEGTVPPATLLTDKAELLAMLVNSGDITADELVQIANGASVDIVLTVKEANVSDEVKTAMAQAAKGYTIGQYLDISLFKYMTVNGSHQAGVALHTTKDALTISVVVPDALINTNSAVNRTYCIVRRHDGAITVLDAAFDAASKTLTFKTDRFSDYAIAYKDTAVPSSGSNPGSNNSSNGSETKKNEVAAPTPAPASTSKPSTITAMPQTGDTSNPTLYVVLLVASLLGLAVVFVCKKRNDK